MPCDSGRLARLLASVVTQPPNNYASLEANVQTAAPQHRELFDALRQRDSIRARAIAETPVAESADHVIGMLADRGLWKDESA